MLESLHRRARTRRLARALEVMTEGQVATYPILPITERPPATEYPGPTFTGVTDALWERLTPEALEAMTAALGDLHDGQWAHLPEQDRRRSLLALALHHGVPGVEETTGLLARMPPEDVHAMSHHLLATGGPLAYGDLIAAALAASGAPLTTGQRVLDFGSSSGRVLRVLHAYDPGLDCVGCDPNGPAIEWAAANLPGITFFRSGTAPPLALEDASVDVALAISIWSHFDEGSARAWLQEMTRIVRAGGHLLLTAQGWQSIAYFAEVPGNTIEFQRPMAHDLYRSGFGFVDVFDGHDWGVPAEGWGMGYLTAEWLAQEVTPAWAITLMRSGGVEGNQDLYVLRRAED